MYTCKYHWGTWIWGYIHTISVVDHRDQNICNERIQLLKAANELFVCQTCKKEYQNYLEKLDKLEIKPMYLFYWSVDLHNHVNKKLGKLQWGYDQALKKWCTK